MKTILDDKDVNTLMIDSFINGGLTELYHCECFIDWENKDNSTNYLKAKETLNKALADKTFIGTFSDTICIEDIYLKMLQDYGITFKDECSGDDKGNLVLTYAMAKSNLQKALDNDNKDKWFLGQVQQVIPEYNDADAWTYFHILQGALFSEVIYG